MSLQGPPQRRVICCSYTPVLSPVEAPLQVICESAIVSAPGVSECVQVLQGIHFQVLTRGEGSGNLAPFLRSFSCGGSPLREGDAASTVTRAELEEQ